MEHQNIPKDTSSEVLLCEDFNLLNEAAPRLMRALADGVRMSIGDLRKMAEEGRLTSAVLLGNPSLGNQ